MNHKIKVVWLATWWPRSDHPVYGAFTQREAKAIAPYCDLVVIHVQPRLTKEYILEQKAEGTYREIIVHCPKGSGFRGQIRMFRGWRLALNSLENEGFMPDLLHVHVLSVAGLAAVFFHRKTGVPMFVSEHWSGYSLPSPPIGFLKKWIYGQVVAYSDAVFVVSKNMGDSMRRLGMESRYVISPNLVDTDFFSIPTTSPTQPPFHFLHVSNLDESHKNIGGLLRAFAVVAANHDVQLTLIGGDEGINHVENHVKLLDLNGKVRILGVQRSEVVRDEMQRSHAFVLFSNREGLPCVMLEAMSVGLPVISSDVPGLEDWIGPSTGILVRRGDENALSRAMTEMLINATTYDKKKIRERIIMECRPEAVAGRMLREYQAVVAAARNLS